ncbi:MAG: hypothetical protein Ta2D_07630 [Rickettsiales bacterium]|nr:MAG: hypothetical protein Ta2D_07630 [Rickettsiales bacterium]
MTDIGKKVQDWTISKKEDLISFFANVYPDEGINNNGTLKYNDGGTSCYAWEYRGDNGKNYFIKILKDSSQYTEIEEQRIPQVKKIVREYANNGGNASIPDESISITAEKLQGNLPQELKDLFLNKLIAKDNLILNKDFKFLEPVNTRRIIRSDKLANASQRAFAAPKNHLLEHDISEKYLQTSIAPKDIEKEFETLGKFHSYFLEKDEAKAVGHLFSDPIFSYNEVKDMVKSNKININPAQQRSFNKIINKINSLQPTWEKIDKFPKTLTHNDAHPLNFLQDENGKISLIDFDDASYKTAIYDLSLPLVYGNLKDEQIEAMFKGYIKGGGDLKKEQVEEIYNVYLLQKLSQFALKIKENDVEFLNNKDNLDNIVLVIDEIEKKQQNNTPLKIFKKIEQEKVLNKLFIKPKIEGRIR